KAEQADQVMQDLVARVPSAPAYLARARYLREVGVRQEANKDTLLKQAEQDLAAARKLAPDDADMILESAELSRALGKLAAAREQARRGLELHATNARLYKLLAAVEIQAERPEEAAACLRRGMRALPGDKELPWLLADLLIGQGQTAEAKVLVGRV